MRDLPEMAANGGNSSRLMLPGVSVAAKGIKFSRLVYHNVWIMGEKGRLKNRFQTA